MSPVVPFKKRSPPGPDVLPGLEGFYVVTADGELGRYEADGRFIKDPALGQALADGLHTLLRRYRDGDVEDLALGLLTPPVPDEPWRSASLVFSDVALRRIFTTSNEPGVPLTGFQRRNKRHSIFQGMDLVLDVRQHDQPDKPRYCPVLFGPQAGEKVLCRRYNLETVEARRALEVLDLMTVFGPDEARPPVLYQMVRDVRQDRIAPDLRRAPDLLFVEDEEPASRPAFAYQSTPDASLEDTWEALPAPPGGSWRDGDPVTARLLAAFSPFNELTDQQREFIARGRTVVTKPVGSLLIRRGSREDITICLIDGTLKMKAADGKKAKITAGTLQARQPVSQLRPHAYSVKAATDVAVCCLSQDLVRQISHIAVLRRSRPGIEVTEGPPLPPDTPRR